MNETPPTPPPGYYPDGGGNRRWWDGRGWTEHIEPVAPVAPVAPVGPTASATPSATQPEASPTMTFPIANTAIGSTDRPWFKKKRIIIPGALVALFLIIGGIGAAAEDDTGDKDTSEASAKPAKDSDGDGVVDAKDAFPSDAAESDDENANGIGDRADAKAAKEAKDEADAKQAAVEKAAKDKRNKEIANAPFVSQRDLARVFKDPDSQQGDTFKVWGEITQFDAATGTEGFLADTAHTDTRSYGYFEGDSAVFAGDEGLLDKMVEGDLFVATVEVNGSYSYDTQIGGNTTVPQFQVLKIDRK